MMTRFALKKCVTVFMKRSTKALSGNRRLSFDGPEEHDSLRTPCPLFCVDDQCLFDSHSLPLVVTPP